MVGFLEIKGSLVGYQRALRVSFKPDGAASLTQCCEHGQLGVAHLAVLLFLLLRTSVTRLPFFKVQYRKQVTGRLFIVIV